MSWGIADIYIGTNSVVVWNHCFSSCPSCHYWFNDESPNERSRLPNCSSRQLVSHCQSLWAVSWIPVWQTLIDERLGARGVLGSQNRECRCQWLTLKGDTQSAQQQVAFRLYCLVAALSQQCNMLCNVILAVLSPPYGHQTLWCTTH